MMVDCACGISCKDVFGLKKIPPFDLIAEKGHAKQKHDTHAWISVCDQDKGKVLHSLIE